MLKAACGDRGDLREQVEALEIVAAELDRDVDALVWELRPTALDDLGLRAALANYVQNWSKRVSISAELHASGLLDDRLASEAAEESTLAGRSGNWYDNSSYYYAQDQSRTDDR
jgi:signal transduction histidine kinase